MNIPRVSLVIPAFNEEKYIKACLDSVTENAQGKLFEIIVVDNASTDATAKIAQGVAGVTVLREVQKGTSAARDCGFRASKGDVIAYIDADTRMPKGWVEKIEKEFSRNENLACLSGPYVYYDSPLYQKCLTVLYWQCAFLVSVLLGYMVIGGNFAIRRSVLEKMNGFDRSIAFYGDDTNIARRAHAYGKVKFSLSFAMFTSSRRFSGQGFFRTALLYVKNFFSEVFLSRPATKEYTDIR